MGRLEKRIERLEKENARLTAELVAAKATRGPLFDNGAVGAVLALSSTYEGLPV